MSEHACVNCATLEARYVAQEEWILKLTAQVARVNPDSQGMGKLLATNNSENRMLGKRLMKAEAELSDMEKAVHLNKIAHNRLHEKLDQAQAAAADMRLALDDLLRSHRELHSENPVLVAIYEEPAERALSSDAGKGLLASLAQARALLARNEWINVGGTKRCPECWRTPGDGHAWNPPCALALALERAKEEVEEP